MSLTSVRRCVHVPVAGLLAGARSYTETKIHLTSELAEGSRWRWTLAIHKDGHDTGVQGRCGLSQREPKPPFNQEARDDASLPDARLCQGGFVKKKQVLLC
jgi:hypothetical protein